jgi:predicted dehydrogenase
MGSPDTLPPLRWAVVGPGAIAQRLARTLACIPDQRRAAVIDRGAGLHALCETPLVTNADEADELCALARRRGRLLIEEAIRCIALGRVESPAVPHADTVAVLRRVDAMRRTLGVR